MEKALISQIVGKREICFVYFMFLVYIFKVLSRTLGLKKTDSSRILNTTCLWSLLFWSNAFYYFTKFDSLNQNVNIALLEPSMFEFIYWLRVNYSRKHLYRDVFFLEVFDKTLEALTFFCFFFEITMYVKMYEKVLPTPGVEPGPSG